MTKLTAKSRNSLKIKIQRVKTAFFAKRIDKDEPSGKTLEYTFKSDGNRTKTKKQKEKIAKIILKNEKEKGNLNNTDKRTSLKEIISCFTQDKYNKDDCINISLLKSKVSFKKQKTANLGDELYIVVQTENMPNRKIKMNLKQGDKKVLTDVQEAIYVTEEGSNTANILFTATVGAFAKKNKNTITNASDFIDYAIAKITLKSTNKDTNKKYEKALKDTKGKKANLYIAMDAEPANNDYLSVKYEEMFDNRPNIWYYGDGNWFEVKNNTLWRNPIDKPMLCLYSQGGNRKPWHGSFGKKIRDKTRKHTGADLLAEPSTKAYACVKSKVVKIYTSGTMAGNAVILKVLDVETFKSLKKDYKLLYKNKGELIDVGFNYKGPFYLVFWHLQKNDYFKEGDVVKHDDIIGLTGVSGGNGVNFTTRNPHLHFEITNDYTLAGINKRCNPSVYFDFKSENDLTEAEKKYQLKLKNKEWK